MIRLKINNEEVTTEKGTILIKLLQERGFDVPHLCYVEGLDHFTSCMLCMVKDNKTGRLIPSCSLPAEEGMDILSDDEEVHDARKMTLDLLLSDHVGDCEAPCTLACPAHMDIPKMNRLLQEGQVSKALAIVKKDIAIPGILGRICSAPCEKVCRRKDIDEPVSICLLKRHAGDLGISEEDSWMKPDEALAGKRLAVIGSGPAGLAAAYHSQLKGIQTTVFEKREVAGGDLHAIGEAILPTDVIKKEVEIIEETGVEFKLGFSVDKNKFDELRKRYDAVIIASGALDEALRDWGVTSYKQGIKVNRNTYETNLPGVFAIGSVLRPMQMAVKSVGHGKEASFSVVQYLKGEKMQGEPAIFNSRFGRLNVDEREEFLKESIDYHRVEPVYGKAKGLTLEEVIEEAARCIHCDCRKMDSCKLRNYSDIYGASQKHFTGIERRKVIKVVEHNTAMYEPAKCIKCGICVRITTKNKEKLGLTFVGRGFDIKIGIPFDEELQEGLSITAEEAIRNCPTGALCEKDFE